MPYKLSPQQSGLHPHQVEIKAYDHNWPLIAAAAIKDLKRVIGGNLIQLEHIGSTSIAGIAAKPVIDLLGVVGSLDELDNILPAVELLGYQGHGEFGIEGRRFYTLTDSEGKRLTHVHIYQSGSGHIERHLAFRDYLRADPAIAQAYEAEKLRAAALWPGDSMAYNDEKAAWIKQVETDACHWYQSLASK